MLKSKVPYFDCGKGWHPIIEKLLEVIKNDPVEVTVQQIKEKFGGLRFYYYGGSEVTHQAVREAEEECKNVCEFCGEPGKERNLPWIRVLCDKHYEEQVQQFKSYGRNT